MPSIIMSRTDSWSSLLYTSLSHSAYSFDGALPVLATLQVFVDGVTSGSYTAKIVLSHPLIFFKIPTMLCSATEDIILL